MIVHKKKTISKILKLKENRKRELELEVKEATDRVDEEKLKLQALEKDYMDTLKLFHDKHTDGSLNVNHITSYYDFFSRISGKIDEQKKIHAQHEDQLASLKNTLVNAHRDKKVFEILNENAKKKDHREKAASEQKESDFLALSRKVR